jgi:hypothetical protein
MSIPRKFDVNCPKCGKKYQATVFESLNSDFAPNVAETIISGERFNGTCPKCGFVAHLEYDVLYHDMKHRAMVWVIHDNNANYAQKMVEVRSTPALYKTTRIVADMNELREKVACLEAGKDDRVVELCKFFLSAQLMEQQPDYNFRNAFYTFSGGKNIVFFYDDKGKEMSCYLENQIYDLISDMFAVPLSQMDNSPYMIIDQDWAADFFELLPTESEEFPEDQEVDAETLNSEVSESADCENTEKHVEEDMNAFLEEASEQPSQKRILFCRKCGAKLLSDSLFCSYCGTKVIF